MAKLPSFVVIKTVHGELVANVIKSHLESQGIPVILRHESAGRLFGICVDGLGAVRILVPREFAEEAERIIESKEPEQTEE